MTDGYVTRSHHISSVLWKSLRDVSNISWENKVLPKVVWTKISFQGFVVSEFPFPKTPNCDQSGNSEEDVKPSAKNEAKGIVNDAFLKNIV